MNIVFLSLPSALRVAGREIRNLSNSRGGVAQKRSSRSRSPLDLKSLATHLDRTFISPTPCDLTVSTHLVLMDGPSSPLVGLAPLDHLEGLPLHVLHGQLLVVDLAPSVLAQLALENHVDHHVSLRLAALYLVI